MDSEKVQNKCNMRRFLLVLESLLLAAVSFVYDPSQPVKEGV